MTPPTNSRAISASSTQDNRAHGGSPYARHALSLRLRFSAAKQRTMIAADGSIMAAIMTVHMVNTASQFAIDHADMGIISCAAGLCILVAPHSRRSQPPSVGAQMPAAVHGCARIRSCEDAVKVASALVGERSKETVSASDIASDPVNARETVTGWPGEMASGCPLISATTLPLNRLHLG